MKWMFRDENVKRQENNGMSGWNIRRRRRVIRRFRCCTSSNVDPVENVRKRWNNIARSPLTGSHRKHLENVLKTLENDWNQTSYGVNKRNLSSTSTTHRGYRAYVYQIERMISVTVPPVHRSEILSMRRINCTYPCWSGTLDLSIFQLQTDR